MITRLQIEGMAIIESLSIPFSPGFNVITGETGAGKSILIKALNFLMGGKTQPDTVRKGSSAATVTGDFSVRLGHPVLPLLESLGIEAEEENGRVGILLRRQLTDKGKAQGWVNDVPVTSPTLRSLGVSLLDIFAQHENQRLMKETEHLAYVDSFVKDRDLLGNVEALNRRCLETIHEVSELLAGFQDRQKNRDYVEFRLKAMKEFDPTEEDYLQVASLSQDGDSRRRVSTAIGGALAALEGEDSNPARALREAAKCLATLEGLGDPFQKVPELRAQAEGMANQLDDLNFELTKLSASVDVDEGELEAAQERLYGYQNLFRKHGTPTVEALMAESTRLEGELGFLETAESRLGDLVETLSSRARDLEKAAKRLTTARQEAAVRIRKAVESELEELVMKGAEFGVEFEPTVRPLPALDFGAFGPEILESWQGAAEILASVGDHGAERGRFLLAANPGEPRLPLARFASGGEMSRILLALKKALVADAETCVLVFDEIDTGISGRVADVVGRKLRELSADFQILCISHLAQVAVYADTHCLVKKVKRGERTESQIVLLSDDESAHEIARLLSGAKVDETSLAQAKNLKEKARGKAKRKRPAELR